MIAKLIKENLPSANYKFAELDKNEFILNALEWHWVNGNSPMSTPYWADKVGHQTLDRFIYALSDAGWVISKANAVAKWGEFYLSQAMIDKHIDRETQNAYRIKARIKKYAMRNTVDTTSDLVKTATGIKATGLDRKGFARAATTPFKLDTRYLFKYYDAVRLNLTKSMDKIAKKYPTISLDEANYGSISGELLDYYLCHPENTYTLEGNISDSRGRSIYNGIKRIGNPISNKDFRACLVTTTPKFITEDSREALDDIYLFIAELAGHNAKSWAGKRFAGMVAYKKRKLHTLDLTNEDDRKDLHENIWLERMYDKLDTLYAEGFVMWDIFIEVDATMSLAQVVGTLTNDERLLNRTNVINPDELLDAWFVEGVPRLHTKTVGTPVFYGSAQTATKLLRSKKLEYTREHIKILNREFNKGAFGVIKAFKDFLIQYANVETPVINMHIWDDKFEVHVNKFRPVGAKTNAYSIWNSETKRQVVFLNHTVETVPDYDRFRLYYPTGLVHNLDSQLADKTLRKVPQNEPTISIHDAFLCLPGSSVRRVYVSLLEELRANRHTILRNYRKSIGATSRAADVAWARLMEKVHQLDDSVPFAISALK